MAAYNASITSAQAALIERAPPFFGARADPRLAKGPNGEGPVNISPKGGVRLHILTPNRVAYLDRRGSGNETARHALSGGLVTLMACSFEERDAAIVRLYGTARILPLECSAIAAKETGAAAQWPSRQVVEIDVHTAATSCGYGVPVMSFVRERRRDDRGRRYKEERQMRAGSGPASLPFRRARDPQERDQHHQQDRRGIEEVERGEREGLLVHELVEKRVLRLLRHAERAEGLERRGGGRIAGRQPLHDVGVMHGGAVLPQRGGDGSRERARGDAQEVVQPRGGGDLVLAHAGEGERHQRYEEARHRRALQDRRHDERPDVDLRGEVRAHPRDDGEDDERGGGEEPRVDAAAEAPHDRRQHEREETDRRKHQAGVGGGVAEVLLQP